MYKKLISSILIIALFTQIVGCYSHQAITKDEFSQTEDYTDLQVLTKNQNWYEFDEGDYTVKEDSIYGSGKLLKLKSENKRYIDFNGSIYIEDVESLKIDRFNPISTFLSMAVVVVVFLLFISIDFDWGPTLQQ